MTIPLYRVICEELKQRISSGTYPRGAALPSEGELSKEFGVSLITVRHAIQELVLDGLIERRQGIGSFVRDQPREVIIGLSSFTSDVGAGRLRLVRTLLADDMAPAPPEVAEKLGVQTGSLLRHLVRLDAEGGVPLSVDEAFIPPALGASLTSEMASSPLFLDLWQQQTGMSLARTDISISVESASTADRDWLRIGPDVPLLVTRELIFDTSGRAFLWVVTRYRGDCCRLSSSTMLVGEHGD